MMIPSTTIYEILFFNEERTILNAENSKVLSYSIGNVIHDSEPDIWVENETWKNNLE